MICGKSILNLQRYATIYLFAGQKMSVCPSCRRAMHFAQKKSDPL